MDNNYFDFLGQNSVPNNENSNTSNDTKGKVNLTVRVDADCQVICDGDFLFLVNANQIVKEKAPVGQHIFNFTSLDYPDATVEKIVDFPVEGNNYLIVVNDLNEKVQQLQQIKKDKMAAEEAERQRKNEEEEKTKANEALKNAIELSKNEKYQEAIELFSKYKGYLNQEQMAELGNCFYHLEDYKESEYWLLEGQKAKKETNKTLCFYLGKLYGDSNFDKHDYRKAIDYYRYSYGDKRFDFDAVINMIDLYCNLAKKEEDDWEAHELYGEAIEVGLWVKDDLFDTLPKHQKLLFLNIWAPVHWRYGEKTDYTYWVRDKLIDSKIDNEIEKCYPDARWETTNALYYLAALYWKEAGITKNTKDIDSALKLLEAAKNRDTEGYNWGFLHPTVKSYILGGMEKIKNA